MRHKVAKKREEEGEMKWEINKIFRYKVIIAVYICTVIVKKNVNLEYYKYNDVESFWVKMYQFHTFFYHIPTDVSALSTT